LTRHTPRAAHYAARFGIDSATLVVQALADTD